MINQVVTLELELDFLAYSLTWNVMETMMLTCARGLTCTSVSYLFFLLESSFEPLDPDDLGGQLPLIISHLRPAAGLLCIISLLRNVLPTNCRAVSYSLYLFFSAVPEEMPSWP